MTLVFLLFVADRDNEKQGIIGKQTFLGNSVITWEDIFCISQAETGWRCDLN